MWNKVCSDIFLQTIREFNKNHIRYFIMRNYEGLPDYNTSKDIDIIIEPGTYKSARDILLRAYRDNGCTNYFETFPNRIYGMSIDKNIAIHIDLNEGYVVKGYEIFTFEEMYCHVREYGEFYVLDEFFEVLLTLIFKLFGYKKPEIKEKYREKIFTLFIKQETGYLKQLSKLTNENFAQTIIESVKKKDFEDIISKAGKFTKLLKKYAFRKNPFRTVKNTISFWGGKAIRIIFCYRKHARVIAVLAPDGTGKTTFIYNIVEKINYFYVCDEKDGRSDVRHFRPEVFPNLGALGEKAGIMEQDTNWECPHREEPANPVSSLFRMIYYTLDYIIGWQKIVRQDVRYDRFTIYDRYSYDFIVDPHRSKINLPKSIRRFFIFFTPKPKITFVLTADPEIIYDRKQELTFEEIKRQCAEYKKLLQTDKRMHEIDAETSEEQMSEGAIRIIINTFTKKL